MEGGIRSSITALIPSCGADVVSVKGLDKLGAAGGRTGRPKSAQGTGWGSNPPRHQKNLKDKRKPAKQRNPRATQRRKGHRARKRDKRLNAKRALSEAKRTQRGVVELAQAENEGTERRRQHRRFIFSPSSPSTKRAPANSREPRPRRGRPEGEEPEAAPAARSERLAPDVTEQDATARTVAASGGRRASH